MKAIHSLLLTGCLFACTPAAALQTLQSTRQTITEQFPNLLAGQFPNLLAGNDNRSTEEKAQSDVYLATFAANRGRCADAAIAPYSLKCVQYNIKHHRAELASAIGDTAVIYGQEFSDLPQIPKAELRAAWVLHAKLGQMDADIENIYPKILERAAEFTKCSAEIKAEVDAQFKRVKQQG